MGKDARTYLDLKVTAISEGVDIKGYIDPDKINWIRAYSPLHEHQMEN